MRYGNRIDHFQSENYRVVQSIRNLSRQSGLGRHGENLTISFLSMNRPSLSKRLLSSIAEYIPNFAGKILCTDNGSTDGVIEDLQAEAARLGLNLEIQDLKRNYGVAGGRNRSIEATTTEWIMFLDNDIYFVENPLPDIDDAISALGCKFVNLPLLDSDAKSVFALGGHLFLDMLESELHVGGGSAVRPSAPISSRPTRPFLGTFLFGGASVVNIECFRNLGGFDEGMFVGFEDTDFSISINKAGYKIGNASVLALVHDHSSPATPEDIAYEKKRFSRNLLKVSASHFERKNGLKVWNSGVEEWLETRNKQLGLLDNSKKQKLSVHDSKPKIKLIVDTTDWAFANIARNIKKSLDNKFDTQIIAAESFDHDPVKTLLAASDADLIHFFWREHIKALFSPAAQKSFRDYGTGVDDYLIALKRKTKITTSIYDHLYLKKEELKAREYIYTWIVDAYTVSSKKLEKIYKDIPSYPNPIMSISDGVDLDLFSTQAESLGSDRENQFVVGWVGNSEWGNPRTDHKGLRTIVIPAIEALERKGLKVKRHFADKAERHRSRAEMVEYYKEIDVLVCSSLNEGTPNPVLEAMAAGLPIVSTDVGIVGEAFGTKQSQFIVPRSFESLSQALELLALNPNLRLELGQENSAQAVNWTWNHVADGFDKFFSDTLHSSD